MAEHLRLLRPFAAAIVAALAAAPTASRSAEVAFEDGGSLYVSTVDASFFPQCAYPDWTFFRATGSKDALDGQGRRVFSLRTDSTGAGTTFAGTFAASVTSSGTVRATWTFTPSADIEVKTLSVGLYLDVSAFAGGRYVVSTKTVDLPAAQPEAAGLEWSAATDFCEIYDASGARRLRIDCPATMLVSAQDERKWGKSVYNFRFEIAADQWNALKSYSGGRAYTLELELTAGDGSEGFEISGGEWVAAAGEDWIPAPDFAWIAEGTALDFSAQRGTDAPAGRHGRVVRRGRHFEFEGLPGVPQRFYGANLCYGANVPSSGAETLARQFARMGYNAVRFHHHDFQITQQGGGAATNLNAREIDRFDRLAAAFVAEGVYFTTDLYVSRNNEMEWRALGIDRDGRLAQEDFKRLVLVHEPAFSNLCDFARNFLGHVNPYLGRSLAEEPAMIGISLVNEGAVSETESPKALCERYGQWGEAWAEWIAARKAAEPAAYAAASVSPPASMDRFFLRFVQELEERFFARMRAFLRDELGCRAPLSNLNGIHYSLAVLSARAAACDYADDHFYVDHPQFLERSWSLPVALGNLQPFRNQGMGMQACAARRLADRPYTVTEFNYSAPGRYRAAGGLAAGAMAALQDWDGVWRFAWAHSAAAATDPASVPTDFFNVATDPIQLATERAAVCLFLRRDLPALEGDLVARIPAAVAAGPAEGNARSLESPWRWAGWFAKLGYVVGGAEALPAGAADLGELPAASSLSDAQVRAALGLGDALPAGEWGALAAGGAVQADGASGAFAVATPRSAGGFAESGTVSHGPLSFDLEGGAASVFVASVDGRPLRVSNRLLVTHLTDGLDTGTTFSNPSRGVLKAWGRLPHLLRAGTAAIRLAVDAGPSVFRVWALDPDGSRRRPVACSVSGGVLSFTADVAADPSCATWLYEIERAERPVPVFADPATDGVEPLVIRGGALTLSIRNATAGAWYTVYESPAANGDYRASKSVRATASGILALPDVDATAATKFLRVGVSDAQVSAGTPLP